jgi:hypothetical protein
MHTRGRELLRGLRWPVGPKLVFDQRAAPVLEIMGGCLYATNKVIVTVCLFDHFCLPVSVEHDAFI